MILLLPHSYSFPKFTPINPNPNLIITTTTTNNPHFTYRNHLTSISSSLRSIHPKPNPNPNLLTSLKPYVQSEWKTIINGWICSAVSVYTLSKIVPKVGKLSAVTSVEQLRTEGLVIGGLWLVRLVANYMQQSLIWEAALKSVYRVRVYVFERVLRRELGFWEGGEGKMVGDVSYRITAEGSDVADTVFALLNTVVPSSLQLFAMATQMVAISPVLSFVSALVISLMALVSAYFGEELREVSTKANLSIAAVSAYLNEVLPAILFVKANNAEYNECMRFKRLAHDDLYKRLNKKRMKTLVPQIVQLTLFAVLLAIFVGSSIAASDLSSVISFITSLVLLIEPIQDVGKAYNELKQGEPAIERLFQLSSFKPKVTKEINEVRVESVAGEVKFCNVSFAYGDSTPLILNKLDLYIKAGETVALVGPSGGGKTTLVKLLLRLYDPLSGHILIDSHNIQSLSLESLRTHVGLVTQDTVRTIAENIGYRDLLTKIDMEKVKHAAQIANAVEFIESLPEGYATNIGPRGSLLSGGQRQRLAIARALYQNPSILVLDEATSALDTRSEMLVRQALQRIMKDRTVIVIAHRLETVLMAERVFLLKEGKAQEISRSSLQDDRHDSLASSGLVI
ncbi:ABC transporter B family member 29, chloroplastic isoform X2 [Helianthus annuus]|uniref:ABC transporter B family member 29, chloroplastic isoform X2 n=1 Tax=Helianthus annuus TaxID=4232 RepID=UPI000B8F5E8A|nr:ABC transporter B family member 29, chloroplastic isoform X2 [Helianthus annuus]